jgi:hypothetical protein
LSSKTIKSNTITFFIILNKCFVALPLSEIRKQL